MTLAPIDLLTKSVPDLVNAAVAEMKRLGEAGDARAREHHAALARTPGAARIVLEGEGGLDIYLVSESAELRAEKSAPAVPVLFSVSLPAEAAEVALEEHGGELEAARPRLAQRLARLSPQKMRAALDRLAQEQLRFHLVIRDTPDFEEVRLKVATGESEPPAQPAFTVTLDYATLEQLAARKLKPQALLSRLKLSGDSARAMQVAMELAQRSGGG